MVRFAATSAALLAASMAQAACIGPAVNSATINLIAEFEGFRADVYIDPTGNPTVGYGHLCQKSGCSEVPYHIPLSQADGKKLLASDVKTPQNCITQQTAEPVTLNANQYGALVSWAYNVGCGNSGSSSLIARLNRGENPKTVIAQELPLWNKGGGQVLPGLVRRRAAEVDLANTATSVGALPASTC
ncbi:putative glycoside hydrolase family 24 protein [Rosellinia necatrix]|uniref:Putative glycoside hydrolase family 24 protein n=1 Tax=Rosellinia necatrix TaxID=77044 RepID=A0A1W2TCP1_ROSNE|nr:putative glycoside hydrolase family 24 protein [Rosellinia necatrix]